MRIAIVNDMPLAVMALKRALSVGSNYEVAWVAKDGVEAVEKCAADVPDLVLMDLIMPKMNGVEATKRIMANSPCAILVVTVSVGSNAWRVFEAMGHGALDAVDTPALGRGDPKQGAAPLINKIEILRRLVLDRGKLDLSMFGSAARGRFAAQKASLVVIGASAGGPAAVAKVLAGLPKNFRAAIVVVQHVDVKFAQSMADWLDVESPLPVTVAVEGARVLPGQVLLAGSNDHLVMKPGGALGYTAEPKDYVYRPSVDVFMQSVIHHWKGGMVGVLLSGMGRDGALGLRSMRNLGCHTIAQDQATCAVYGMPKAAAQLNAAVEVLSVDVIADQLVRHCGRSF
ncbi:MAG: Wsp signal transduction system protein-glutamate methylesterase WspF [Synoicihabitans sp.]